MAFHRRVVRRLVALLLLGSVWCGLGIRPGLAQFAVIDAGNLVQNTINVLQSISQVVNQGTQIANEVTMIANQVQHLANQDLDLTTLVTTIVPLLGRIEGMAQVLEGAEGLAYELSALQADYAALYPDFGASAPSSQAIAAQITAWNTQIRRAALSASEAQSVLERVTQGQGDVQTALHASQSAVGNLQAVQSGNQLLGLVNEQLLDLKVVIAASERANATAAAAEAAGADAGQAHAARLLRGLTDRPTTRPGRRDFPTLAY